MGRRILLFNMFVVFVGFLTFLFGFFPVKNSQLSSTNNGHVPATGSTTLKPSYDRLVFILIDALRADFVFSSVTGVKPGSGVSKIESLRLMVEEKEAFGFIAKAHSPTVTLPRIKAMVTGSVPGFIDVVINFGSSSLAGDSLLHQLFNVGKRLVFYGDDTWIRLFPNLFKRSDGTTSFFVSDYTEVDDNVTRHINTELARDDWDIMILHYLGLDHIGHLAGPYSPLVAPKLREMDGIITHLHHHLQTQTRRTLVLVCGDHGMSDQGSHGGSTTSEILVPIVMFNPADSSDACVKSSELVRGESRIWQTDITPTLALLFGVPIPADSVGVIIPSILCHFNADDQLTVVRTNARHLANLYFATFGNDDTHQMFVDAAKRHTVLSEATDWSIAHSQSEAAAISLMYMDTMYEMRDRLAAASTNYNLTAMFAGSALIWMGLILTVVSLTRGQGRDERLKVKVRNYQSPVRWSLILGTVMHTISLAASSFVEEEQQTWYFVTASIHVIIATTLITRVLAASHGKGHRGAKRMQHRDHSQGCLADEAKVTGSSMTLTLTRVCVCVGLLMACGRIARAWNRTGNKWLHLPDIGDWLVLPDNREVLSALNASVLLFLLIAECLTRCLATVVKVLFACGLVLVYCYQSATGLLLLPSIYDSFHITQGLREAQMVFVVIALIIIVSVYSYLKHQKPTKPSQESNAASNSTFQSTALTAIGVSWLLLMLLLLRPHNWFLVMLTVVQKRCLFYLSRSLDIVPLDRAILYYWMGQAAFFAQGNSNSIATIDVSAGYVGQADYYPVFIAILMTLATYLQPIYWTLCLITDICNDAHNAKDKIAVGGVLLLLRSTPIAFYVVVVTLQRYHLFVWTVFSPKLLYEGMSLLVHCVMICIIFFAFN